jgi:AhpD family alkylhydroperoxidase
MEDWLGYRADLSKIFADVEQTSPNTLKGVQLLSEAAPKASLGAKVRELIALAVAVTTRCDGCIAFHADWPAKPGRPRKRSQKRSASPSH